jgi:hypothetical protein
MTYDPIQRVLQQCKAERSYDPLEHLRRNGYPLSDDDWNRIWSSIPKWSGRKKDPDKLRRDERKKGLIREYKVQKKIEGYGKPATERATLKAMSKFPDIPENVARELIRGGDNRLSKAAKIPTE